MIQSAFDCLQLFGKPIPSLAPALRAHLTRDWFLPSSSPLILDAPVFTREVEEKIIRFFAREKKRHAFAHAVPYVCVESRRQPRYAEFKRDMNARGWKELENYQLCLWHERWPFRPREGFRYVNGRLDDRALIRDAMRVWTKGFQLDEAFFRKANRTLRPILNNVAVSVIYTKTGQPAAAAAVGFKNAHAYLFNGAVLPAYRERGLWRDLIALRQSFGDARTWLMTTSNPRIRCKADAWTDLTVFELNGPRNGSNRAPAEV